MTCDLSNFGGKHLSLYKLLGGFFLKSYYEKEYTG